jgi:hypothetical protein
MACCRHSEPSDSSKLEFIAESLSPVRADCGFAPPVLAYIYPFLTRCLYERYIYARLQMRKL